MSKLTKTKRRELHASALEGPGPWLIRSHYWNCWHRRSAEGGACGYTDDIAKAGVFELAKAREYHDEFGGRDEAIPVQRVVADLNRRLAELAAEQNAIAATISRVSGCAAASRQALSTEGEG